jgi:hypothetical protein
VDVISTNFNNTYFPAFVSGAGIRSVRIDDATTPLTYNPASCTLTDEITHSRNYSQNNRTFVGSRNNHSVFVTNNEAGMAALTTGDFNTCIGGNIFQNLQAGSNNFGMGFNCGNNLRNSSNNCFVGHRSGLGINASGTTTAEFNCAVGDSALTSGNQLQFCVGIGGAAGGGDLITGTFNTCIGGASECANNLSFATVIGGLARVNTSNTIQLGRPVDNVNISGTLTINNKSFEGTTVAIFRNEDTVNFSPIRDIRFMPNAEGGDFNPYTSTADAVIWGHSASINTQTLMLTTHSNTSVGMRINPTFLQLGWGGTIGAPTNRLTFDTNGARFSVVPKTSVAPSVGDDLCNKTYVDAVVPTNINATANDTSTIHYPVFVAGTGSQQVRIDNGLTTLSYKPDTGQLSAAFLAAIKLQIGINNGSNTILATFIDTTTGVNRMIQIMTNPTGGSFNPFVSAGDSMIWAQGSVQGDQPIIITFWSSIRAGMRISSAGLVLGWGGTGGGAPTSRLTFDTNGTRFSDVPKTSVAPSVGDDLCNKTYVDAVVPNSINVNAWSSGTLYYPVLADGTGNKLLYVDNDASPFAYNPSANILTARNINGLGDLTGRASVNTPLQIIAPSTNTGTLTIKHENASSAGNILIHTTGLPVGGSISLRTNGASGKGLSIAVFGATTFDHQEIFLTPVVTPPSPTLTALGFGAGTDNTNWVSGFNSSRTQFNANGRNTIYGNNIGLSMNIASVNNTLIGQSAAVNLTTGNANTLIGAVAGANTTSGGNNVAVGQNALNLNTTGTNNTAIGRDSLSSNISSNGNVAIGNGAGNTITGGNNICIGNNVQVPVAANSNQIAIGSTISTMWIQGQLNLKTGGEISANVTLPTAGNIISQFYSVRVPTSTTVTITLPSPANTYLGCTIYFKRKVTNAGSFALTCAVTNSFIPNASIAAATTVTFATSVFKVRVISDGSHWCVMDQ